MNASMREESRDPGSQRDILAVKSPALIPMTRPEIPTSVFRRRSKASE